jgi:hypothetical protein
MNRTQLIIPLLAIVTCACTSIAPATPWSGTQIPITMDVQPFTASTQCTDSFVAHQLAHTTVAPTPVRLFLSNGSGVAAGDVNADGLTDLVLANIAGDATLAVNDGSFSFRELPLDLPNTRAIQIVDINGDGFADISATHLGAGVSILLNNNTPALPSFHRAQIAFGNIRAYSMLWHDFNGDQRLDLVTGSYDAEALRGGAQGLFDTQSSGVFIHTQNADSSFTTTRLSESANALSIAALDIDADGFDDIVVGNDFDTRDMVWLHHGTLWTATEPFESTPHSTMSYDIADFNRDGLPDLLAADMNPYATDVTTLAQWLPVTSRMTQYHPADDPQLMENAILQRRSDLRWYNTSRSVSATSTGWSWSTRFGDLDSDGNLDIYAVNGMIAFDLFPFLPDHALVEHNQALRYDGVRYSAKPSWKLDATAQGRGMTMTDLNNDGRLDIVVNNLQSPSIVYENQLCGGAALRVALHQPGTNPSAIGAQLRLSTATATRWATITNTRGYLSGDTPTVHYGLGTEVPTMLTIRWPDGLISSVPNPPVGTMLSIERSTP